MKKLAVLFPGIGYHCDKPLLYYSKKCLSAYGYEIIDKWVDYCMIEDDTLAATATAEWLMDIAGPAPA